jgi:TolB protein
MMNADGTEKRQLTDSPENNAACSWRSNGTILFYSSRDGLYQIYIMSEDGGNQQKLKVSAVNEALPYYSPDGSKIVYTAILEPQTSRTEIHVMNADATGDVTLSTPGHVNEDAYWSPDGEHIVFQTSRDGNYEVYTMKADGTNQRRLTQNPAWDGWPGWGKKD